MATKATGFRFTEEVIEKMEYLCDVTGLSKTQLIANYILSDYDRLQGNPELKKTIAQMKELEAQMKAFMGQK